MRGHEPAFRSAPADPVRARSSRTGGGWRMLIVTGEAGSSARFLADTPNKAGHTEPGDRRSVRQRRGMTQPHPAHRGGWEADLCRAFRADRHGAKKRRCDQVIRASPEAAAGDDRRRAAASRVAAA